tara:strand:+ start:238 stop:432 length:195 start_codon:yes stop_codon:yes gene_type:complete
MVKVGNKVSMIYNMGKEGVVVGLVPVNLPKRQYAVPVSNTWKLLIEWKDGSRTEEAISDVMRID